MKLFELKSTTCFTLENFRLVCLCNSYSCKCFISVSTFAFALRHLPKLQRALTLSRDTEFNVDISQVIKILHSVKNMERQKFAFNEACREAATRIGQEKNFITSTTALSTSVFDKGSLSLTYLDLSLQIDQLDILRAIGNLCPNLKDIQIISGDTKGYVLKPHSEHSTLHDEVNTILKGWPKVEFILFFNVTCDSCMRSILDPLGPTLEVLAFHSCPKINLANLVPCVELEHLDIAGPISKLNFRAGSPSDVQTDTFLPRLKTLKSEICLGCWSPIFESKPTLTELALSCCHIGTRVITPRLEWSEVPVFWSNLQTLELRQCSGITMTMFYQLIPRLEKLKSINLPASMMRKEPELTPEILRDSLNRDEPFEIGVSDYDDACQLQLP